ncbi:MAG: hypothetical protein GC134_02630 [Proteobacteria bacterium]|nr:hypothetical protein [Pseudomonadota bacterium]
MRTFAGVFWVLVMAGAPYGLSLYDPELKGLAAVLAWWLSCGVGQMAAYRIATLMGRTSPDNMQMAGLTGVLVGMVVFPAAIYYPLVLMITIPLTLLALSMSASLKFAPGVMRTWSRDKR